MSLSLDPVLKAAAAAPIVPVLVVPSLAHAAPLAQALWAGGLTTAEVTLRTASGLDVITAMKKAEPKLIVGAGTVLSGEDAHAAVEAGADFLVSPGMTKTLRKSLGKLKAILIPGVATASEAMARQEEGFQYLKLFPAVAAGGVAALKGLGGPLPALRFMPTGGITAETARAFLALPNVFAVGGSWLATDADLEAGEWSGIEGKARTALALVRAKG